MVTLGVPAPEIFAPHVLRQLARSTISGSIAALSIMVVPSASTAAIIRFSVAPTDTISMLIWAPFRRPELRALMYPSSTSTSAPKASMPFKCRSTGRLPIAQPPGKETLASPYLVSKGPNTKIEARMVFTSS